MTEEGLFLPMTEKGFSLAGPLAQCRHRHGPIGLLPPTKTLRGDGDDDNNELRHLRYKFPHYSHCNYQIINEKKKN